jgi:Uma2 family endonuclease
MSTILEIPKLPSSVVLDPPLTDEEFEKLCAANDLVKLERTKEGTIIVNAPTGADSSSGNIEISYQLAAWWKQHRQGRYSIPTPGSSSPTVLPSVRMEPTPQPSRCMASPRKTGDTFSASRLLL